MRVNLALADPLIERKNDMEKIVLKQRENHVRQVSGESETGRDRQSER